MLINNQLKIGKMRRIKYVAILSLLTLGAEAQELLTVQDAIKIGVENAYSIRIASNEVAIARNNNSYGNAGFFPKVDATASASTKESTEKVTKLDNSTATTTPRTMSINGSIALSWTIFDGMGMFIAKDKLSLLQLQEETSLRASVESTMAQILSLYNTIVQQNKLISVYEQTMSISQRRMQIAKTGRAVGAISEVALLKAEVDYKTDSSNLVQQKLATENLKAEMNLLIGRAPETKFEVAGQSFEPIELSYKELLAKALEQNPALIRARQEQEVNQLNIKEANSRGLPSITLSSSYTYNSNSYKDAASNKLQSYGPYVGATASIPLFDGFNVRRNVKNARLAASNAEIRAAQAESELRTDLLKAFNLLTTTRTVVAIEQKSMELAQKNVNIAVKAYEEGAISDIEVREAQRSFIDVAFRLLKAQADLKNQEVELKRLSGSLSLGK